MRGRSIARTGVSRSAAAAVAQSSNQIVKRTFASSGASVAAVPRNTVRTRATLFDPAQSVRLPGVGTTTTDAMKLMSPKELSVVTIALLGLNGRLSSKQKVPVAGRVMALAGRLFDSPGTGVPSM